MAVCRNQRQLASGVSLIDGSVAPRGGRLPLPWAGAHARIPTRAHASPPLRPACSRLRLGRLSRGTRGPTAQHGPASGVAGGSKCRWTLPAKWVRTERTRILTDYLIAILGP